jgi:hypothetical protein
MGTSSTIWSIGGDSTIGCKGSKTTIKLFGLSKGTVSFSITAMGYS